MSNLLFDHQNYVLQRNAEDRVKLHPDKDIDWRIYRELCRWFGSLPKAEGFLTVRIH